MSDPLYMKRGRTLLRRCVAAYIDLMIFDFFALCTAQYFNDRLDWGSILVLIGLEGAVVYLFKDLLRPSLGKRIMGLQVRAADFSDPPNWKLVIRNLTVLILPIEFLVVLCSDRRQRLSDKWLGLTVVRSI